MQNKISVIIVEDHDIYRNGIKTAVESLGYTQVIAEANDGKEFLNIIETKIPDIVFMDVRMPDINGIEATKAALEKYPDLNIIALTSYNEGKYIKGMSEAGAKGFLLKNIKKEKIDLAIRSVLAGENYYSAEILEYFKKKNRNSEIINELHLTKREIEILQLVVLGYNTNAISERLFISPRTVERHRSDLLKKTNCKNTPCLIGFAIENGFVESPKSQNIFSELTRIS